MQKFDRLTKYVVCEIYGDPNFPKNISAFENSTDVSQKQWQNDQGVDCVKIKTTK